MKQPTLQEVKEYFKNADLVQSSHTKWKSNIKIETIRTDRALDNNYVCDSNHECGITTLYSSKYGYAKILTYKEKTFSITESQINELKESLSLFGMKERLKEWFPESEAFESEVKLETGKWYKSCINTLAFYSGNEENYGFSCSGDWGNKIILKSEWDKCAQGIWTEATEQEVFEALKNEAVKRGFGCGTYFNSLHENKQGRHINCLSTGVFEYNKETNCLHALTPENTWETNQSNPVVFECGVFAEIIPTITKEEAEQQLGKKIIV